MSGTLDKEDKSDSGRNVSSSVISQTLSSWTTLVPVRARMHSYMQVQLPRARGQIVTDQLDHRTRTSFSRRLDSSWRKPNESCMVDRARSTRRLVVDLKSHQTTTTTWRLNINFQCSSTHVEKCLCAMHTITSNDVRPHFLVQVSEVEEELQCTSIVHGRLCPIALALTKWNLGRWWQQAATSGDESAEAWRGLMWSIIWRAVMLHCIEPCTYAWCAGGMNSTRQMLWTKS